jgi:hypothetical protein
LYFRHELWWVTVKSWFNPRMSGGSLKDQVVGIVEMGIRIILKGSDGSGTLASIYVLCPCTSSIFVFCTGSEY